MDQWTDRLSEYLDDELDAATSAALETHLDVCDECSKILEDLRSIRSQAAALEPIAPTHDLWAGIAAAIGTEAVAAPASVISLPQERARRSVSFTLPQLAAAAMILIALGAALVWQLGPAAGGRSATQLARNAEAAADPVASDNNPAGDGGTAGSDIDPSTLPGSDAGGVSGTDAGGTPGGAASGSTAGEAGVQNTAADRQVNPGSAGSVRNASATRRAVPPVSQLGYDAAIRELEEAASQNTQQLDPATVRVLQESMKTIDRAIADARAALAKDPANAYLHRHLDRTMKQKLEILRQAAKIDRGGA